MASAPSVSCAQSWTVLPSRLRAGRRPGTVRCRTAASRRGRRTAPPVASGRLRRSRSSSSVAISGPCTTRPGIALHLGDIAAVVVDAMPVERQRRIAEQQHVIGAGSSRRHCASAGAACAGGAGSPGFGLSRYTMSCSSTSASPPSSNDLVAHSHEHQRPAAPLLRADVGDARGARRSRWPTRQGPQEFESDCRPTSAAAAARAAGSRRASGARRGRSRTGGAPAGSTASATAAARCRRAAARGRRGRAWRPAPAPAWPWPCPPMFPRGRSRISDVRCRSPRGVSCVSLGCGLIHCGGRTAICEILHAPIQYRKGL